MLGTLAGGFFVDAARARGAEKRGAGAVKINIEDTTVVASEPEAMILALDDALTRFAADAPRQAKVVELRYSVG